MPFKNIRKDLFYDGVAKDDAAITYVKLFDLYHPEGATNVKRASFNFPLINNYDYSTAMLMFKSLDEAKTWIEQRDLQEYL